MRTRDYRIRMPRDTMIVAACEDVGCDQWRHGWETICDETDLTPVTGGAAVAMLIRSGQTGRTFTEFPGKTVTVFRFDSGQRCFREHRTRPARFTVRQGGLVTSHVRLADWGDDLAEHAGILQDQHKRG